MRGRRRSLSLASSFGSRSAFGGGRLKAGRGVYLSSLQVTLQPGVVGRVVGRVEDDLLDADGRPLQQIRRLPQQIRKLQKEKKRPRHG